MTLSPKLGVVGISTLWHFRLPLPIQMFIKVASSPRLSGIGMPSPILWSHPLKMQRIVLLSSLLWWELGTNSLITGPGEWLSFRRFTSNYPDPEHLLPHQRYSGIGPLSWLMSTKSARSCGSTPETMQRKPVDNENSIFWFTYIACFLRDSWMSNRSKRRPSSARVCLRHFCLWTRNFKKSL